MTGWQEDPGCGAGYSSRLQLFVLMVASRFGLLL
jgi:hypothetical protein